ncbi:MAG: diguanylate cyclase [Acidobacteriota bacterium]
MRILIAEDEPVSRLRLERLLGKWGYDVIAVADGEQAWRQLEDPDAPGLAILDWQMPGTDGVSVCRKVRALKGAPYVYIILLTARNETDSLVEAMNAGADDFLSKPFEPHELEARLRAGQRILRLQQELIAAREALREHATRDDLTGVWNRRSILETLEQELARASRSNKPGGLGVLIADLDHFKRINDSHGHFVGDEVLREVVRRLERRGRRYDSLGRLGGEEFLLLLPGCQLSQVETVGDRFRELIATQPIDTTSGPLPVTSSFGAAWVAHGQACSARQILEAADRALYAAKDAGRNRLCFQDPKTNPGGGSQPGKPAAAGPLNFDTRQAACEASHSIVP